MTPKVNGCALVEGRGNAAVPGIGGTDTPNLIGGQVYAANEKIAIGIDVERAPCRRVRDIDRIHPGESTINRTAELSAAVIVSVGAPKLILESTTCAVG